uniref:C2H2-type domain-containing protein n=1 Tax=Coturnix japonica TaxID=93934 RepID=A0A8C2SNJ5_COTJA
MGHRGSVQPPASIWGLQTRGDGCTRSPPGPRSAPRVGGQRGEAVFPPPEVSDGATLPLRALIPAPAGVLLAPGGLTLAPGASAAPPSGTSSSDGPLTRHSKTHTGPTLRLPCSICGKEFRDPAYLLRHQAAHGGQRHDYQCDVCGKAYAAPQSLLRHRQAHGGRSSGLPCSDGKTEGLVLPAPGRSFGCTICGRAFGRRETLKRHERIHTGEKPHQCAVCGKRFRESFHLRHKEAHVAEKPFGCEACGKTFGFIENLMWHQLGHRAAPEAPDGRWSPPASIGGGGGGRGGSLPPHRQPRAAYTRAGGRARWIEREENGRTEELGGGSPGGRVPAVAAGLLAAPLCGRLLRVPGSYLQRHSITHFR